jgi:hypothetical protein
MGNSVLDIVQQWSGKTFREESIGRSYEGRDIRAFTFGDGRAKVLAWSQMHGNEPTSTLALLDVLNSIEADQTMKELLRHSITLTAIPLLNPDGCIRHDRRNAQGIDINRDAQSLISPEAKILMSAWERLHPDFAYNLHDQETRYTTLNPPTPTLIAMLAPECSHDKAITPARERAMKLIAHTAKHLDNICDGAKGRIARYDDVYTPTAFGDTFMQLGTSSILIEAGSMPGDPERTHARAAMSMAIIKGLEAIAQHQFEANTVQEYDSLPLNKDFDGLEMILEGIAIHDTLGNYQADLGIRRVKTSCNPEDFIDDSHDLRVMNIGDLSSTPSIIRTKLNGYTLKGTHKDLYIGCKTSDITLVAPDGNCINAYTLIENNTRDFDSDKTK